MRKILFTLVLSLAVVTASFHAQVKQFVKKEITTNKNIHLAISAENNYDLEVYRDCEAKLDVTVVKFRGQKADTIVHKGFAPFKLNELSSFAQSFDENIGVLSVVDRKELIVVNYTVTYLSGGSILRVEQKRLVPRGVLEDSLVVKI